MLAHFASKIFVPLCLLALAPARLALADPGPSTPERAAPGQHPAFTRQRAAPSPPEPSAYRVEMVASGLKRPWAIAFLPDKRMLVTERGGQLRLVTPHGLVASNEQPAAVAGLPPVRASGTAGLLDIVLDPAFATNNLVYVSYFEPRGDEAGIAIGRARLDLQGAGAALTDFTVIFRALPSAKGNENVGARLLFGRDGMLYATIGDRFDTREQAQDLGSDLGKLIRITRDGAAPSDNPFVGVIGARPEIYALGQRNAEGLALEPVTGAIWELENGAKGGDELNLVAKGANYGWPVITYGRGYDDKPIGTGTAKNGMAQPVYYWDPSIAPSGFAFYDGDQFPDWRGNIFVASLKGRHVSRLVLSDGRVVAEEQMLGELHSRIRTIAQGPDGALYVLTDEDNGRLVRMLPPALLTRNTRAIRP